MRNPGTTSHGRSHEERELSDRLLSRSRASTSHLPASRCAAGWQLAASGALALGLLALGSCSSTETPPEEPISEPDATEPGAESRTQDPAEVLREDAERLELREQRQRFLVENFLANARAYRDRLRLEEARDELLAALELDPDNLEVKQMLAEVGALMGEDYGSEIQTVSEEMQRVYELQVQQLKAEAQDNLREGEIHLSRGDYDAAIAELTIALNHIRWAPYSIDWEGVDEKAEDLLARAKAEKGMAEEARLVEAQRQAFEEIRTEEDSKRERSQAIVDNLVAQAIVAFDEERYDDAMYYADQALRKDPRNGQAIDIRDSAFKAGRDSVREEYITKKREQYARWREQLDELRIPWTEVVTLPDPEQWAEITRMRSHRPGLDLSQQISEGERALRETLRRMTLRLSPVEDEESLRKVVDDIRLVTNLPLVVDPTAEEAVFDAGIVYSFSFENELTVEQALNLIAGMSGDAVTWTVRHDAVIFTTIEKASGAPIVMHHDVQDLVFGLTDFLGPRIDRIRLLDDLEDEDGGGPFGGVGERPQLISIDELQAMITENVAITTWENEGVSIEPYEGHIIIVQTPEVQAQVQQFLEDLRRFSSSLVTIDSKFMRVAENWLQEIGVDFRGLDDNVLTDVTNGLEDMASRGLDNNGTGSQGPNAAGSPSSGFFYDDGGDGDFRGRTENYFETPLGKGISNIGGLTFQYTLLNDLQMSMILRAVEKSQNFELINDQVLSVHNTQRAYVTVINQRAYIQDFDVEVAQFQAVADPQVNVLTEGVVLDVRPTIHHDRKYLTLEVQPTVAKVVALRNFSTTLGGNTSPVEFQLPELAVESVFTTAVIPDGGSILLGGLTDIRNIERRAEVPWLAKIPILGFFFKQEGYNDEKETLLILIRARITDVREEVAKIDGQ